MTPICPARSTKDGQVILTCELEPDHEGDHLDPYRIAWSEVPPTAPDPLEAMRRVLDAFGGVPVRILGGMSEGEQQELIADALAVAKELQRIHKALEWEPLARVLLRELSTPPNGIQVDWLRAVRDAADAVRRLAGVSG